MKYFLYSFVLSFLTFNSFAQQTWVSNNAKWIYQFTQPAVEGYLEIEHTGDTIIESKECKVFSSTEHRFYQTSPESEVTEQEISQPKNYTYVSNDTVFYWADNQFRVLYDFSGAVNENWILSQNITIGFCSGEASTTISETGAILLNGVNYTTLNITSDPSSLYKLNGKANQHFGIYEVDGFYALPFPVISACGDEGLNDNNYYSFCSFSDDNLSYPANSEDCKYHLGINKPNLSITLFPNPTHNTLQVNTELIVKSVELRDLLGKTYTIEISNDIIDISHLPNQNYILTLNYKGGLKRIKLLKI